MVLDQKQKRTYPFVAFRYSNYRLFWVGNAFSNIGIWVLMAGRLWLMHLLTGSATMLGLLTFANTIPILIFSMWGGVLADKFNRLQTIRFTRSLFALQAFVTAALIIANLIISDAEP